MEEPEEPLDETRRRVQARNARSLEALKRRQAVSALPFEDRRRLMFQNLDPDEKLSGQKLEAALNVVESVTAEGKYDLALMAPAVRKAFELMIRRKAKGLNFIQRAFKLPRIIDSNDPGNRDPLGLNRERDQKVNELLDSFSRDAAEDSPDGDGFEETR